MNKQDHEDDPPQQPVPGAQRASDAQQQRDRQGEKTSIDVDPQDGIDPPIERTHAPQR